MPPLNLIAITFLWPLSHILSERKFHSLNVLCTRVLSLPILLLIALYERQRISDSSLKETREKLRNAFTSRLPTSLSQKMSLLEGAHWETEAVFEYTPNGDEKSDDEDEGEVQLGADEGIEEWILEGKGPDGQRRVSSRFSSHLDPNKVQEQLVKEEHRQQEQQQQDGSPLSAPISISRQASFARTQKNEKATSPDPPPASAEATPPATDQSILKRTRPRAGSRAADQTVQFANTVRPPRRGNTRDSTGERLPANASGQIGDGRMSGSPQQLEFPQLISTSAPGRESPFLRRYLNGEAGTSSSGALGRRLSLSTGTRSRAWSEVTGGGRGTSIGMASNGSASGGVAEETVSQLMKMMKGLVETVDRLEKKLEEKGKGAERDEGDESAIDTDDDE